MTDFAVGDIIQVPKDPERYKGERDRDTLGVITGFQVGGSVVYVRGLGDGLDFHSRDVSDCKHAKLGRGRGHYRRKGSLTGGDPWCIDPGKDYEKLSVTVSSDRWEDS